MSAETDGRLGPPIAVTFDFWNTLVVEVPGAAERRVAGWVALLAEAGHEVERGALDQESEALVEARVERWIAGEHFAAAEAADALMARLGLLESIPPSVRERLVETFADPGDDHVPTLTSHVGETIAALHGAGVRIGIICDVGFTPSPVLRRHLDEHGLLRYFHSWSFSDEVGVFKPDAAIFRHALDGLGVDEPSRVAHVGDLRRTDVAGAQAMGMLAVRYCGAYDDAGDPESGTDLIEGDMVIADHADLPAALGIT